MKLFQLGSFLLMPLLGMSELNGDSQKVVEKMQKLFPFNEWKTVGFCGYKKEPIVTMKVPKFLSWPKNCNLRLVKDGIEYCGPDESSPRLSGQVSLDGKEYIFQVGMEAGISKSGGSSFFSLSIFEAGWGASAVLAKREIQLGGYRAAEGLIEDTQNSSSKPTKVMTLINYFHPYVSGSLYFIESVRDEKGERFLLHKDWVFQWAVDRIKESFEFKVKVQDNSQAKTKAT